MTPNITIYDDNNLFIEFIHPLVRFGINLSSNRKHLEWFCISKSLDIAINGEFDLPEVGHYERPGDKSAGVLVEL